MKDQEDEKFEIIKLVSQVNTRYRLLEKKLGKGFDRRDGRDRLEYGDSSKWW